MMTNTIVKAMKRAKITLFLLAVTFILGSTGQLYAGNTETESESAMNPGFIDVPYYPGDSFLMNHEIIDYSQMLLPYLSKNSEGFLSLDIQDPDSLGINPKIFEVLKESLAKTNSLIKQGILEVKEDLSIHKKIREGADHAMAGGFFGTSIEYYPFGFIVCMDYKTTNRVIRILSNGAKPFIAILNALAQHNYFNNIATATLVHLTFTFWIVGPGILYEMNNEYGCGVCIIVVWGVGPVDGWARDDC